MTEKSFPEGLEYWSLSRAAEEACESTSSELLSAKESAVSAQLGSITSMLYRVACCHWGCHEKEHVFEYLAGRTCTSVHSAYRLIGFGYYDEALGLSRNISEIGNLVHLFFTENSHIRGWLDLPERERRKTYSPVGVRRALEDLGAIVPTDQDKYSWLCEIGTHVTPKTLPQAHNSDKRPILGAVFQPEGLDTALESLAWSTCTVSCPLAKLAILDRGHAELLLEETIALAESL
jgi:hypothetical protein